MSEDWDGTVYLYRMQKDGRRGISDTAEANVGHDRRASNPGYIVGPVVKVTLPLRAKRRKGPAK